MRALALEHDPYDGLCFLPRGPVFEGDDGREALPRSKWCKYCLEFAETSIDYPYAMFARRSAKRRMTRAYRDITTLRPRLFDQVLALHRTGVIRKRFRAAELIPYLRQAFSENQIRDGLASLVQNDPRSDYPRLERVAKYTYEIDDPR